MLRHTTMPTRWRAAVASDGAHIVVEACVPCRDTTPAQNWPLLAVALLGPPAPVVMAEPVDRP